MSTALLFGIPVQAETMDEVLARVDSVIQHRESLDIGVVNAAKVVNMRKDTELSNAVLDSDVIYADGMSVVWASRILGRPLPQRIAGIDLMHAILRRGQERGYRVFCLGATQEVLDSVCESFANDYPGSVVVGSHHGYFDQGDEPEIAELIRDARADVLFIGMSSPKKERFISNWSQTMQVPVVHGVGGSFDIVAGVVKRAPESWQRAGLEWLYRLIQEPGRLWRRYLVTNTVFLWMLLRELVKPETRKSRAIAKH